MFGAYWIWKCFVVDRQHQTQLMQMQEQIRTLTASQERMEDSLVRGVSNSAHSYSYRPGAALPTHSRHLAQPGGGAAPVASNDGGKYQGEASYINPSFTQVPRTNERNHHSQRKEYSE